MDWVGREPPVGVFRPDLIAARSFALADAARRLLRGTAALALGLAWSAGAGAADLQWSADGITPGGGGTANWNTAAPARWYNGVTFQTWNNAALDTAVFGGVAGAVTINAPVTAQNLTFNTSGYTVTRTGSNTLTLAGANPTIDVAGGTATVSTVIAGTAGLTKAGAGALTLSGANTYTGGTTINAGTVVFSLDTNLGNASGGITFNGGTLQNTATVTTNRGVTVNAGGGAVNTDPTRTLTLGGVITGSGPLAKNGTGTLTLTGESPSFTGTTTINAGTLQIGNGATGSVAGDIVDNSALVFNRTGSLIYGGAISGAGTVTKSGTGTLTLTGANTHSGTTTISSSGGTLQAGATNAFSANSAHTLNTSAVLDLGGFSQTIGSLAGSAGTVTNSGVAAATLTTGGNNTPTVFSGIIQNGVGGTSLTKEGTGTFILAGNNTYTGATTINEGTLQIGNGGNSGNVSGDIVNNSALVFNRTGTLSYGQVISGSGSVTKNGSVTLTLTGDNTYSGGTTINAGTLVVNADARLGDASGGLTFGGGTLQSTATFTSDRDVTLSGNGTFNTNSGTTLTLGGVIGGAGALTKSGSGTLTLTGANSYAGGATISAGTLQVGNGGASGSIVGNIVNSGTVAFNRSDDLTYGGSISGAGALTKSGAGTLTLAGSNSYSGATTVSANGGTLKGGANNAFSATSAHTLNANTVIDLAGFNQSIGSLASSGGAGTVTNSGGAGATLTTGNNNAATTFSGVIQDGLGVTGLTKVGTGTFTLTGANTYTGLTTISGGTLQIGSGATGSIVGDIVNNSALTFNRSGTLTYGGAISGAGTVTKTGSGALTLTGTNSYNGGTTISGGTLAVSSDANLGNASGALAFGAGTLQSTATFTSNRGVTLNAGGGTFNTSAGTTLTLGGVITGAGTLTKSGTGTLALTANNTNTGVTTISAGTLQLGNGGAAGIVGGNISLGSTSSTLVFNRSDDLTYGGNITGSGAAAGGFTKSNGNTLTLTGTNTYSGGTAINGGTLKAGTNNRFSASSTHTVASGAFLDLAGFNQAIGSLAGAGTVTNSAAAGVTLTTGGNNGSTTFSGVIEDGAGTTSLTKAGTGTLTLSGTNTYSGGTTINAGTLAVSSDANLGNASGGLTINGGTLQTTGNLSSNRDMTLNGNGTFNANSGTISTLGGVISGAGSFTKIGTGTLTLSGVNTYGGGTTISGGTLAVSNNANLGNASGGLTLSGGGTLRFDAGFASNRGVTLNAGGGVFNTNGNSASLNGAITGAGTLTKSGAGTLTLAGSSAYSGATTISTNGGTLQAGASNVFSSASAFTVNTGGSLDIFGFDQTIGSLAGAGTITNSGVAGATLTTGGNNTSTTFSGVIQNGTGGTAVTKVGAGTLILTGANTYTGGTTISSGTLQIGTGGGSGSIAGDILDSAALVFNRSGTLSYGGVISGTGTVAKSGTGTLTLTGDSAYTGGTTINAGTLQLGNGGATGSIVGDVLNNSALVFNRSNALSFGGVISGTGAVTQAGTGTTTLTAANTYGGGTTLNAGTLAVSNDANLGNASGGLTFGGGSLQYLSGFTSNRAVTLNAGGGMFDTNGNDATLAGAIGGAGGLAKSGAGTLTLSGTSAYTGGSSINGGTLQAGALNAFSATSAHTVNPGAVLDLAGFNQTIGSLAGAGTVTNTGVAGVTLTTGGNNASTTFSGVLQDSAGAIGLIKLGAGTLTLSGANTYSGGTTLAAGTLRLENDAALGSGSLTTTGSVVDYAGGVTIGNPLVVNSNTTQLLVTTGTATQAGSISELAGPRPIEKIGAGVLVLTAANTYTGGTTISAGTLQLGNGGASGSIAGEVINNGVLAINRSDRYALNGVISGTGALEQNGTGATILTTTNTYSGTTTINAGTLIVGGSIANSAVIVNNGALLTGNGAVGPTTINGALLPGQSIGAITVNGNLTFGAVGVYIVEVSPASADRTNVIGTAALNGTVLAIFAPGSYITRQYTILHADGGLGGTRFTNLSSSNLPASLSANLSYTSSDVLLNLTANLGEAIGTAGLSRNQQNVASALNAYFNNGGTMPPSFSGLFGLTGTNLGTALTLLSGEAATGAQQVGLAMTSQFLGLMLDPFVDGRSGATGADGPALGFAPESGTQPDRLALAFPSALQAAGNKGAAFEQRIRPWGAAYGGTSRTAGDPIGIGSHDLSARSTGIVGGLDLHLTPDGVMGVALAGGAAQWSVAQGLGGGQSDAFQAGIYGATRSGAAYLSGALAYTNHWMSTDRFALGGDHLTAKFNAQGFGARVEGGYRLGTAFGAFTPYAALQAQRLGTPNYAEADLTNGGYALGYLAHTGTGTRSELGGHFDRVLALRADAALALRARLAWAHDWVSDPTLVAEFQSLPGAGFMVTGTVPVKDSLLVSAGSELRLANGLSLSGKFDGEFADRLQAYGGSATVRYAW